MLLRPISQSSNLTEVESSLQEHVVLNSITVSLLLDMEPMEERNTFSSRTHGEPHGVSKDTLKLEPTISAVSLCNHHTQLNELFIESKILFYLFTLNN